MANTQAYTDLEIRIFARVVEGYPVELTLKGGPKFPRGYLDAAFLPWIPSSSPEADGESLFDLVVKTGGQRANISRFAVSAEE